MFKVEIKELNEISRSNTGYFQQTAFWSEFKENHGWAFKKFSVSWIHEEADAKGNEQCNGSSEVCVLVRSFAHGMFSLAYVPLFPSLPLKDVDAETQNIEFTILLA